MKYQLDVKFCVLLKIDPMKLVCFQTEIKDFMLILWIISKYCYRIEYIGKHDKKCINDKKNRKENRKTIDEFNMKAYYTYFKI